MDIRELRSRFHELIDATKSEEFLQCLYELLRGQEKGEETGVWSSLSEADRERVLKAYSTALDPRNLSTTEAVMKRRKEVDVYKYLGVLKLDEDPVELQRKWRGEW